MSLARALILRAAGTNCDAEAAYAFKQAGAKPELVNISELISKRVKLSNYQILTFPGGFTYGDDLGAGKVLANEIRLKLTEDINKFIESGGLIIGICNGFQVLVKTGILPGPTITSQVKITLAGNDSGKFECRWVYLKTASDSNCIFIKGIERMYLPIAHGEGKLIAEADALTRINAALYYVDEQGNKAGYPYNPNGSTDNIAGICDDTGRIFAMMPHPERHTRKSQHPRWTRGDAGEAGDGLKVFLNAVEWTKNL